MLIWYMVYWLGRSLVGLWVLESVFPFCASCLHSLRLPWFCWLHWILSLCFAVLDCLHACQHSFFNSSGVSGVRVQHDCGSYVCFSCRSVLAGVLGSNGQVTT
ncbi:hypothetical protein BDV18DRAFT_122402 [Aspergillus unguis]